MQFESMSSKDYIEEFGQRDYSIPSHLKSLEERRAEELNLKRADTLREIEAVTGFSFSVANIDGREGASVAAFITPKDNKMYLNEVTLDNKKNALHAAWHEIEHKRNKLFNLDPEGQISEQQTYALERALQQKIPYLKMEKVDWVEGFNEALTIQKHGYNDMSAYLKLYVPAVLELEELAKSHLEVSLLSLFAEGNSTQLLNEIEKLTEHLLVDESIEEFMESAEFLSFKEEVKAEANGESFLTNLLSELQNAKESYKIGINTPELALELIQTRFSEVIGIFYQRKALGL